MESTIWCWWIYLRLMLFSAPAPCLSIFCGTSICRSTQFHRCFFPSRQDRYIDMHTGCIRDHCRNSGRHFLVRHFLVISKFQKDQYMVLFRNMLENGAFNVSRIDMWLWKISMSKGTIPFFGHLQLVKVFFGMFVIDVCHLHPPKTKTLTVKAPLK